MSRQEVREEFKETEGNPQMKTRIRRLLRDRIRRNMMKQVPTATAVIVNPTHYAVAIRYQMDMGLGAQRSGQRKELSGAAHPAARHRSPGSADRKSAAGAGALQISGNRTGNPPASVSRGGGNPGVHLPPDAWAATGLEGVRRLGRDESHHGAGNMEGVRGDQSHRRSANWRCPSPFWRSSSR